MEEKKNESVSYFVFEGTMTHYSIIIKRLIMIIVTIIVLNTVTIAGIVAGFLWYISLPIEEYTTSVESESGNANYIGNDMNGDFNYGED